MKEDAILAAARRVIETRTAMEEAEDRRRDYLRNLVELDNAVRLAGDESHRAWEALSSLLHLDEEGAA